MESVISKLLFPLAVVGLGYLCVEGYLKQKEAVPKEPVIKNTAPTVVTQAVAAVLKPIVQAKDRELKIYSIITDQNGGIAEINSTLFIEGREAIVPLEDPVTIRCIKIEKDKVLIEKLPEREKQWLYFGAHE